MNNGPTDRDTPELEIDTVEFEHQHETLHAIRHRVFVDEQGVPVEIERDALDPRCVHVIARWKRTPVGTARLAPNGRIGRMAVLPDYRRYGIGSALLAELLDVAHARGFKEVYLAAQLGSVTFYERFGFKAEGVIFKEAGIDHITMRRLL